MRVLGCTLWLIDVVEKSNSFTHLVLDLVQDTLPLSHPGDLSLWLFMPILSRSEQHTFPGTLIRS